MFTELRVAETTARTIRGNIIKKNNKSPKHIIEFLTFIYRNSMF